MKGRPWSAEETLAIVLEGIKGTKPVAEICREHQIARLGTTTGGERYRMNGFTDARRGYRTCAKDSALAIG